MELQEAVEVKYENVWVTISASQNRNLQKRSTNINIL